MIEIRKVERGDMDIIFKFICTLEQEKFDKKVFKKIYDKNIKNQANIYLIAFDPEPVGFLGCHIQGLLHHCGLIGEIQEMFVVEEKRGLGVGRRLLDKLKEIVLNRGVIQLEVTSGMKRIDAHRFYEQQGFQYTSKKFIWKD